MVFLGIPTAFRHGAMVSVDVLYRSGPAGVRRVLDGLSSRLAALALLGVILWFGWDYAIARRGSRRMAGLERSRCSGPTPALPVGALFCMLAVIGHLLRSARTSSRLRGAGAHDHDHAHRRCCVLLRAQRARSPCRSGWRRSSASQASPTLPLLLVVKEMLRRARQVPAGRHPVLHPRRQPDGSRRHLRAAWSISPRAIVGGVQGGLPAPAC